MQGRLINIAFRQQLKSGFDTATPILILRRSVNAHQHCALAVARSAGRVGIPVFSVRHRSAEPATSSRYVRRILRLNPVAPTDLWIEALTELGSRIGRPMLLPVDDPAAIAVADHQDRLKPHFRLAVAPHGLYRLLASKRRLYELCVELGIPAPRTSFPADVRELEDRAEFYGYPVVLKRGEVCPPGRDKAGPSVIVARDPRQLLSAWDQLQSSPAPDLVLQEHIPGNAAATWLFNGYVDGADQLVCSFTGRKLRQRGTLAGPASWGICTANSKLSEIAGRLLGQLGYRGIVDMDFRYDGRDGSYKLLDVNPRIGSTFRLFVAENGIDVVRAMHLDLTGRPVPPSPAPEGRIWVDERGSAAAAVRAARIGGLGPASRSHSPESIDETAWWAGDDPLPFVSMAINGIPGAVRVLAGARARTRGA